MLGLVCRLVLVDKDAQGAPAGGRGFGPVAGQKPRLSVHVNLHSKLTQRDHLKLTHLHC